MQPSDQVVIPCDEGLTVAEESFSLTDAAYLLDQRAEDLQVTIQALHKTCPDELSFDAFARLCLLLYPFPETGSR